MRKSHGRYTGAKSAKRIFFILFLLFFILSGAAYNQFFSSGQNFPIEELAAGFEPGFSLEIPEYAGEAYVVMNGNTPYFSRTDLPGESYEYYSELDELGRCRTACANIGRDLMPTEKRGEIGQVKPSGWKTAKYDSVEGKYLYNRCHLIGYQLTAENANEKNLITGTRYFNVQGMLPFENMTADYVKETGNHVLYRVTPFFEGEELVARGVLMEGWSVEDEGEGVCFSVFVYNVQPGIIIDYADGDSCLDESREAPSGTSLSGADYILNTGTGRFHDPSCGSVKQMGEKNRQPYIGSREDLIAMGYEPCGECNP